MKVEIGNKNLINTKDAAAGLKQNFDILSEFQGHENQEIDKTS